MKETKEEGRRKDDQETEKEEEGRKKKKGKWKDRKTVNIFFHFTDR